MMIGLQTPPPPAASLAKTKHLPTVIAERGLRRGWKSRRPWMRVSEYVAEVCVYLRQIEVRFLSSIHLQKIDTDASSS